MGRFSVALVHHPVLHKDGSVIASAVTNTDLHDITRSCTAFGVDAFYIVTPVTLQQQLVERLIHHWTKGEGSRKNPDRKFAFGVMRVAASIQDALAEEKREVGTDVEVWSTSARNAPDTTQWPEGRKLIEDLPGVLMLLGTSHGLADEAMALCKRRLAPIEGRLRPDGTRYSHLSVRAAAAILLHQLRG